MSIARDIRRVGELLRPEAGKYAIGLGSLLVLNACDVLAPMFLAVAIDLTEASLTQTAPSTPTLFSIVGLSASQFTLLGAIWVFLALHVVANVLRYPMLMYTSVPSHDISQTLRNRLVGHLLQLSQSFYDRAKSGDLMSLATADLQAVRMMLGPGVLVGADTLFIVGFVLLVLFTLSWKLTLIALIPLPIIVAITNKLAHAEYKRFEAVQEDIASLTERTRESYAGVRILKGYAQEPFDFERFRGFSWRHYLKNIRLARVRSIFEPTLDLMIGTSITLVLIFGGRQVVDGTMTLGTFVAFLFLVTYLAGPMIGFGWSVTLFQRGRASMHRLDRFDRTPIHIPLRDGAPDEAMQGAIEVRGLTFAYPTVEVPEFVSRDEEAQDPTGRSPDDGAATGEPVLRDVSFAIQPGETLGVVGPVGSGKSTLGRLLVRLYEPPDATVFIDGRDITEIDPDRLRDHVVLAPQDTFLFSDTVGRNVVLARDDAADPTRYTTLASIHSEVVALPEGYETMLGERGVDLSGGQRQRLAIARAIAAEPRILILDDCLSAVDARTEQAIIRQLREVFVGRTGVIISHRIRAVQACDRIIVLRHGEVVESGTHDELIAAGGYYAETAREQLREEGGR